MKKLALLFFAWLIAINVFGFIANNRLTLSPDTAYTWIDKNFAFQQQNSSFADMHAKWDSYWYVKIVYDGYEFLGDKKQSNIAFFPLYPLTIWPFVSFFKINPFIMGWIISVVSTFLATLYLYKIAKEFHHNVDPYLAVLLMLIFPTAFFLNTFYAEALFLFLSIASYYYLLKKNYLLAGLLGGLSALTRFTGILLCIPFLIEYFKQEKKFSLLKILPVILIPLSTISFFTYLAFTFGDFFLFFKTQQWWGREFALNPAHLNFSTPPAIANSILDISFALFAIIATIFTFKRLRLSYGVYMASTLATAFATGTLLSMGRIVLVLFPMYLVGASIKDPIYRYIWIVVSSLFLALYTILSVGYYWAG